MLPGPALFALTFLSLFVFNSSLFVNRHFGEANHSLQTNASPVANSGIGLTHRSAQVPVTSATDACPAVPPLLSTNSDVLNRLGSDECSNIVVNLCSSSGLQEKDLLERSYADYLEGSDSVIVKGRLRVNISYWESIGTSQFILNVIRDGYKVPFYYTPSSVHLINNKSALHNAEFVASAITELLKVGSVVECQSPPVVVNSLSVSVQSNGKKRIILDLRHVNFFVKKSKIKFEDAKSFLECLLARPSALGFLF